MLCMIGRALHTNIHLDGSTYMRISEIHLREASKWSMRTCMRKRKRGKRTNMEYGILRQQLFTSVNLSLPRLLFSFPFHNEVINFDLDLPYLVTTLLLKSVLGKIQISPR